MNYLFEEPNLYIATSCSSNPSEIHHRVDRLGQPVPLFGFSSSFPTLSFARKCCSFSYSALLVSRLAKQSQDSETAFDRQMSHGIFGSDS